MFFLVGGRGGGGGRWLGGILSMTTVKPGELSAVSPINLPDHGVLRVETLLGLCSVVVGVRWNGGYFFFLQKRKGKRTFVQLHLVKLFKPQWMRSS